MQDGKQKHIRMRAWLIVLFAFYYLMCGFGVYTHFAAKLPGREDLQRYSGVVRRIENVSGRFSGENIRIEFEDGCRVLMNGSFSQAGRLRTGGEVTVLYQDTPLARDWQGFELRQGGEEIHGYETSLRQVQRERKFNRILLTALILLPPVGLVAGLAYERRLLGKDTKYGA